MKKRKLKRKFKYLLYILFFILLVILAFNIIKNFSNDDSNKLDKKEKNDPIINKLSDLGYDESDIILIKSELSNEEITEIDFYNKDLLEYIKSDYFIFDNFERYISHKDNNSYSIDKIILYVNIGIDRDYYTNIKSIEKEDDLLVLVNKYNSLSQTYEPQDLTEVGSSGKLMRKEAAINMTNLQKDAKKDGIQINMVSGYRSYDYQDGLYSKYLKRDPQSVVDTYSARPGHSEHQTGLAMDVSDHTWTCEEYFEDTLQFEWLQENAYKYGFIMRYPKGKEFITGYTYEPWHYRYVGVDVATKIHTENITYEEYVVKYLTTY